MYRNRVSRRPIRPVGPIRFVHGNCRNRCSMQRSNKFDPLSLYGGLHGLSFDPTDTQALLRAVNALQSTQRGRWSIRTPSDSPCNSCSNSDTSFTRPSTPPSSFPCPFHGQSRAQPIPVAGPTGTCSPGSTLIDSGQEGFPRETFLREKFLQDKLLEDSFMQESQQCPKKDLSEAVRISVGNTGKVSRKRKDLTWVDWGWPGTHVACPFNQRHLVDDSLVPPEQVGHVIMEEVTISVAACAGDSVTSYRNVLVV